MDLNPILLLTTAMVGLTTAWKKPKSWCYAKFSECMTNSAEGTTTPWEPCNLRCICLGFEYGFCEKKCHGEFEYPYTCVCHGFGRNRRKRLPRECFVRDNPLDELSRQNTESFEEIFPGKLAPEKLEPPFD